MKRTLRILFSLMLVLVAVVYLSANASAAEIVASGKCGDAGNNVTWTLDSDGLLTISGSGNMENAPSYAPWYQHAEAIKTAVIGNGVTSVGDAAFFQCVNLTDVSIPNSVTYIGHRAFAGCKSLAKVTIPDSVTRIGVHGFAGCESLTEVVIPDGITKIEYAAFTVCTNLKSVKLPESITYIGQGAFYSCTSLESMVIPSNVTTIDVQAFYNCSSLTTVTLSEKLTLIKDAFDGCYVKKLIITEGSGSVRPDMVICRGSLEEVVLPDSLTSIEDSAFYGCGRLSKVTIPNGVKSIGESAFSSCVSLSSVTIPDSVTTIGNNAFGYCEGLTELILGDGLESIGAAAFQECTSLKSITFGSSDLWIDYAAFFKCDNLKEINITDLKAWLNLSTDEDLTSDPSHGGMRDHRLYLNGVPLTEVVIPDGMTSIRPNAFFGFNNITSIVIPAGVTKLPSSIFPNSYYLKDVYYGGDRDTFLAGYDSEYLPCEFMHYSCVNSNGHWTTENRTTCAGAPYTIDRCPCGYERNATASEHQWIEETCTTPKTCANCQLTDGIVHGHLYFSNGVCSRCGETRTEEPVVSEIKRLAGATRYKTAFAAADELKKILGVAKFDTIIVSSGEEFADALAGSYLASVKNAPILLVKDGTVSAVKEYIKANLNPGGVVYLLGGEKAVPKSMETGLDGFTVRRLGGNTRYDTNLLILKEAGTAGKNILVCTGKDFADSLSASTVGLPILLVKDSLTAAQKEFLSGDIGLIYIIGGEKAVSKKMQSDLLACGGSSARIAGATRYETSVNVAKTFLPAASRAVIAYGENFPDGLSGGPVGNKIGAPLILTREGREKDATEYIKQRSIKSGYVLGGTTVLPEKTVNKVFGK